MNLLRIIFIALLGLLSSSLLVFAKDDDNDKKSEKIETISTDSDIKQYVITFKDEATTADFTEITQWITDNKGEIVEKINENFAKLIIAKSDPSILKLSELKPKSIESVEQDDLDWFDFDKNDL